MAVTRTHLFSKIFAATVAVEIVLALASPLVAGWNQDSKSSFLLGIAALLMTSIFLTLWFLRAALRRATAALPLEGAAKFVFAGWFLSEFVFEFIFYSYRILRGDHVNFFTGHVVPSTLFYVMFFGFWWFFLFRRNFSLEQQFFLFGLTGVFMEQVVLGYGFPLLALGTIAIPLMLFFAVLNIVNYGAMLVLTSYCCEKEFPQGRPRPSEGEMVLAVILPSIGALAIRLLISPLDGEKLTFC